MILNKILEDFERSDQKKGVLFEQKSHKSEQIKHIFKHELPRSELARLSTNKKKAMSEELVMNLINGQLHGNYMFKRKVSRGKCVSLLRETIKRKKI